MRAAGLRCAPAPMAMPESASASSSAEAEASGAEALGRDETGWGDESLSDSSRAVSQPLERDGLLMAAADGTWDASARIATAIRDAQETVRCSERALVRPESRFALIRLTGDVRLLHEPLEPHRGRPILHCLQAFARS